MLYEITMQMASPLNVDTASTLPHLIICDVYRTERFAHRVSDETAARPARSHLVSPRPVPNVAPLMCRTKLDSERLWSDVGATAGSDGLLASNFIREADSNNFRREKICVLNSRTLSK